MTTVDVVLNEYIRSKQVRLIDETGVSQGVIATYDALNRARNLNLDLVQVAEGSPPVCKILDYGKWNFERQKAAKEIAKNQRQAQVDTKEVQLRPVTDEGDLATKSRKAKEFLEDGDKVKIVLKFKGREQSHKDMGRKVIEQFLEKVGDYKIERHITDGGNNLTMLLASVKTKAEILKEREKKVA